MTDAIDFKALRPITQRLIKQTLNEAHHFYCDKHIGTISKALFLQWLAGRLSGYSINCPEPGGTVACLKAEGIIKKMSDKLLGYDVLEND